MCNTTNTDAETRQLNLYKNGVINVFGGVGNSQLSTTKTVDYGMTNWTCNSVDTQNYTTQNSYVYVNGIDTNAPDITLQIPTNGSAMSQTNYNFTWLSTDNYDSTFNCSLNLNGTIYANQTTTNNVAMNRTINGLQGTYWWNVTCIDKSGNINTSTTYNVLFNVIPPAQSGYITSPSSPATYGSIMTYNFSVDLSDASQIASANITIGATTYVMTNTIGNTYVYKYLGLLPGTYTININACDVLGNCHNETHASYQVVNNVFGSCSIYNLTALTATILSTDLLLPVNSTSIMSLNTYFPYLDVNATYPFNFTNANTWSLCMNTNDTAQITGTITYQDIDANYSQQTYTFNNATITGGSPMGLTLYLTPNTQNVVFTIVDHNNNPVSGAIMYVQQVLTGSSAYTTTASSITGFDGKLNLNLVPYVTYYKFLIYDGSTLALETTPIIMTSTTYTFIIPNPDTSVNDWQVLSTASCNLWYNNDTQNFRYDWGTPSGSPIQSCLTIKKLGPHYDTTLNQTCVSSASGSIIIHENTTGGTYVGVGTLQMGNIQVPCGIPVTVAADDVGLVFKDASGLFFAFMIFATLTAIGLYSPVIAVFMATLSLIISVWAHVLVISTGSLLGLIAILGIIIYKLRSGWGG